jgi:multicomponent Na+:H+ antiporter subunit E
MNVFVVNLLLAFVWCGLTATFSLLNLIFGFALGFSALWISRPLYNVTTNYFVRFWRIVRLVVFFLWELIVSSVQVAWAVLTPWSSRQQAAVVAMPLDVTSDLEILMVSSLISLTPGTLSLDVSEDRRTLYVHAMFGEDPDEIVRALKSGMEHRVAEVFRK